MKTPLILAVSILASAPVCAAQREPQINIIFSAENATCTAWSKSADNKLVRQQYEIWARGFASGYNYALPSRQVKVGAFPSGDDLLPSISINSAAIIPNRVSSPERSSWSNS